MENKKQKAKTTLWQFIKFNIVGVSNTLVDFGVYFLLTKLAGMNYILAQTFSYTAGILNSYIWNTLWTFKKEKRRNAREIALFIVVNLISYGVSVGVLALCRDVIGVPNIPVNALGLSFIIEGDFINKCAASFCSAMVNFAGNKLFVFNKENPDTGNNGSNEGTEPTDTGE